MLQVWNKVVSIPKCEVKRTRNEWSSYVKPRKFWCIVLRLLLKLSSFLTIQYGKIDLMWKKDRSTHTTAAAYPIIWKHTLVLSPSEFLYWRKFLEALLGGKGSSISKQSNFVWKILRHSLVLEIDMGTQTHTIINFFPAKKHFQLYRK